MTSLNDDLNSWMSAVRRFTSSPVLLASKKATSCLRTREKETLMDIRLQTVAFTLFYVTLYLSSDAKRVFLMSAATRSPTLDSRMM